MRSVPPNRRSAASRLRLGDRKPSSIFLTGLLGVLPILVTLGVVVWLITTTEAVFSDMLKWVLPNRIYLPGMGLAMALVLVFVTGLAMQGFVSRKLLEWIERSMNRIPLIKSVYGSVRDLTALMSNKGEKRFGGVVMVQLPNLPVRMMGFVTLQELGQLGTAGGDGAVAVYLPMSYQIGGYMVFIPREHVQPIEMSVEDAMRFIVTAGLSRVEVAGATPASTEAEPPPATGPRPE